MLNSILRLVFRALLSLRYRIEIIGLEALSPKDERGMLFLPNHPALIDPFILLCILTAKFPVRALADKNQIDRPGLRWLAERVQVRAILDPRQQGSDSKHQIAKMLRDTVRGLRGGEALVLYPAGRIYRQKFEDLGGNSAVEFLVRACPELRVVLVRTTGLWGSAFSRASGRPPSIVEALRHGAIGLLRSGLLFAPRRHVKIEFREPEGFARGADRHSINRQLEDYYNETALPNTYVPYSIWEGRGSRVMPEPSNVTQGDPLLKVPASTRELVEGYLSNLSGVKELVPSMRLANDLGLDSLTRVEVQAWIEQEFGFPQSEGDALETVGDVLLAACGEGTGPGEAELRPVPERWFSAIHTGPARYQIAAGSTVLEAFLATARRFPSRVVVADQGSGVRSFRDLVTAMLLLRKEFQNYSGEYVGVMLPASVAAVVTYLALLFSGKTPVLVNWTTGPRGVEHCLEQLSVKHVVSARKLFQKLRSEGFGQATALLNRVTYLEELAGRMTSRAKIVAAVQARWSPRALELTRCPDVVAVLFTSGSESLPKAVPLTNENLLTNLRDILSEVDVRGGDALLGMLPPFHSFGLTINMLLPLLTGLPVVYHSNPTESAKLAAHVDAYNASILTGTPTFLGGILRAAKARQLDSLRLAVTGAEKCPARVYDALAERCPQAVVLEGYGITECSPVVSVNRPGRAKRGTIGELLPSVEAVVVDPDQLAPVDPGSRGLLLVRGPSIFSGYLRYSGESPFVEFDGKSWYRTGDLVTQGPDGTLTFVGRLKRFIKLGGEMISLPAIESVLEQAFPAEQDALTRFAVEAMPDQEHAELVLFCVFAVEREAINRHLREAGLSALHNIRRVITVDAIPVLGTGKTDYLALRALLSQSSPAS